MKLLWSHNSNRKLVQVNLLYHPIKKKFNMLYGMSQSNYFKNISSSMYPILARVKEPVVSLHCENKTNHLSYFFPSIDLVTDHH
jgi:hypothetical protein